MYVNRVGTRPRAHYFFPTLGDTLQRALGQLMGEKMTQADRNVVVLIVDPDDAFQAELRSVVAPGMQLVFLDLENATPARAQAARADVAAIAVDSAAGLSLVADLCGHPAMPPVIALSGAGFEGKSVEHVLLLAEARGAALALSKPLDAHDLLLAARQLTATHAAAGLRQDNKKNA